MHHFCRIEHWSADFAVTDTDSTIRQLSAATLRTVYNLAPASIAILDANFTYISANPSYCALTGYTADELMGQPITFSVSSDMVLGKELENSAARGAQPWSGQVRFAKKNGAIAQLEWQVATERVAENRILWATDITQQMRNDQSREASLASERTARADAEHGNPLQEEFLATLSHELRNPLHAIASWSAILNRIPNLPEPVMRGLQAIDRNSKIQAQMIADLQDYAAIIFGKIRSVQGTIDPYPAVRAAIEVVASGAASTGIRIVESFDEARLRIRADPARLQQITVNLLSNAVKFSKKGSSVEVQAGKAGGFFCLMISDHGEGIEPQFLPQIFERCGKQDGTRGHGGLGLGLVIVKQLVELHGGSVEVQSAGKGQGATFRVMIPSAAEATSPS
jgi:PAS domain S-box-containing protein